VTLDYSNNKQIMARIKKKVRIYQEAAIGHGIKHKHTLFDMFMGLGKTVCALTVVFHEAPSKVVILCGQNALGTWIREVAEWFPEYAVDSEFVIIPGKSRAVRGALWARDATFYICTKETFILDQDLIPWKFKAYIIDEAHRIPKHTTKTYKALELALRDIPIKLMLTGTWVKRHAGSGWRHLHMLNRKRFPSYWEFVNRYCVMRDTGFGKEIVGPQNTEEFKQIIADYVFRFKETMGNIPESVRKMIWIPMSTEQTKIYGDLTKQMFHELDDGSLIVAKVSVSSFTKHRQVLCCPKILHESFGLGNAFEQVLATIEEDEDDLEEKHCVIFVPFRIAVENFRQALEARGYPVFVFTGGIPGAEIERRATAFRKLKGQRSIAIGTTDYAESYHLGTATRSHFIGPAWDGDSMRQAEARLARADSDLTKTIVHRYWLYSDTMDEHRTEVIRGRTDHVKKLFQHVDDVMALLAGKVKQ
jgi:SNF2 family DNA or RNA helicase